MQALAGETPLEYSAFNKLPNQLAGKGALSLRLLPALLPSSLPFSSSLPIPPSQRVIETKAGPGSPPSSPKIPPREPQSRRTSQSGERGRKGPPENHIQERGRSRRSSISQQLLAYLDPETQTLSLATKAARALRPPLQLQVSAQGRRLWLGVFPRRLLVCTFRVPSFCCCWWWEEWESQARCPLQSPRLFEATLLNRHQGRSGGEPVLEGMRVPRDGCERWKESFVMAVEPAF